MRLHLRVDRVGKEHTYMSLFINGAFTGNLTMKNAEAIWFHHILWKGTEYLRLKPGEFGFNASGEFPQADDAEINRLAIDQTIR